MISRRLLLAATPGVAASTLLLPHAEAASQDFPAFVDQLRAEARRKGIGSATVQSAFSGVTANEAIIGKLRHPPEFTMTWEKYRALLLTDSRIDEGRAAYRRHAELFGRVQDRYGVSPAIITGIWGLESSYGAKTGDYRVVEALANCAYASPSRRTFFSSELFAALRIIEDGNVTPRHMTGSYAGAMGQPQFMPTSYQHYAVDFDGTGRRDIWTSVPDVLGSIANYLARSGWRAGEGWGMQVAVPDGLDRAVFGRDDKRTLDAWSQLGVRTLGGRPLSGEREARLIQPDGAGGEAFLVFHNFSAIRRYNPSDFYALLTGLLGDAVLA